VPRPGDLVAAFGSLWVQSRDEAAIWRIDPKGDVTARIHDASSSQVDARFGSRSTGLDVGFGSVWSLSDDALVRIDPASDRVVGRVPIDFPYALGVGEGAVWVICCRSQITLLRIDPSTMQADIFARVGTSVGALGVGDGFVWLARFSEAGGMFRIDPTSGEVLDLQVGYNDRFILPTQRWLWLIDDGRAQRIDPSDGSSVDPRHERKAKQSIGASYSHGTVWINNGVAVGFDARSGTVTQRLPAFTGVRWWWTGGIAQLGARIWLADPVGDRVVGVPLDQD
jgi:hypothetical protein